MTVRTDNSRFESVLTWLRNFESVNKIKQFYLFEEYYGEDQYYDDDSTLYLMSFYIVPQRDLRHCAKDKVMEKLGLDPDVEFTEDLIEDIKADPVKDTCNERYNQLYDVSIVLNCMTLWFNFQLNENL